MDEPGRWVRRVLPETPGDVLVFLPVTWWLLTRVLHPVSSGRVEGAGERVAAARASLGALSRGERVVACVFGLAAAACRRANARLPGAAEPLFPRCRANQSPCRSSAPPAWCEAARISLPNIMLTTVVGPVNHFFLVARPTEANA